MKAAELGVISFQGVEIDLRVVSLDDFDNMIEIAYEQAAPAFACEHHDDCECESALSDELKAARSFYVMLCDAYSARVRKPVESRMNARA